MNNTETKNGELILNIIEIIFLFLSVLNNIYNAKKIKDLEYHVNNNNININCDNKKSPENVIT